MAATLVQRKFGEVVRRVYSGEAHFVVEKDGLPVMAIKSMDKDLTGQMTRFISI